MNSDSDGLLKKHDKLVHSEGLKVVSHTQREEGDWVVQTLMIDNISAPFVYKRTKRYKSLAGQKVNVTYYPSVKVVAGFEIETMQVVRIRRY